MHAADLTVLGGLEAGLLAAEPTVLAGDVHALAGALPDRVAVSAAALTVTLGATGAVAALARRGTKPFAYVVFPDGTLHQTPLGDKKVAARVQEDVLRFNTLAETARKGQEHNRE